MTPRCPPTAQNSDSPMAPMPMMDASVSVFRCFSFQLEPPSSVQSRYAPPPSVPFVPSPVSPTAQHVVADVHSMSLRSVRGLR